MERNPAFYWEVYRAVPIGARKVIRITRLLPSAAPQDAVAHLASPHFGDLLLAAGKIPHVAEAIANCHAQRVDDNSGDLHGDGSE